MKRFDHRKQRIRMLPELLGPALEPLCIKRGFSSAAILSWWPEIVGPEYKEVTLPKAITWPRAQRNSGGTRQAGILTVNVAPSHALFFQHEVGIILERLNQFLGYHAIGQIKIVQMPLPTVGTKATIVEAELDRAQQAKVRRQVQNITSERLKKALQNLGESTILQQNM